MNNKIKKSISTNANMKGINNSNIINFHLFNFYIIHLLYNTSLTFSNTVSGVILYMHFGYLQKNLLL